MHRPTLLRALCLGLALAPGATLAQVPGAALAKAPGAAAPETPGVFDRDARRFHLFHDGADAAPDEALDLASEQRRLLPVAGDWNGDGLTDLGVYDPKRRVFLLYADREDGAADVQVTVRSWRPWLRLVAGDFDGDGRDELALYDRYARRFSFLGQDGGGTFTRVLQLSGRRADHLRPFAGDFDGDGKDELGLYDGHGRTAHLLQSKAAGGRELVLRVSERARDLRPVAFDPDGDGRDGLGLFDRSTGRLAILADLADGNADASLDLSGTGGDRLLPVAGTWLRGDDGGGDPEVPDTALCQPVSGVDPAWVAFEEELLAGLNEKRAAGASCGQEGVFPPTTPLAADPSLRCAARLHVRDMAARNVVSQFGADGSVTETRAAAAGYPVLFTGEAVSGGLPSASQVLAGWFAEGITCSMLMEPVFQDAGVGFVDLPAGRRFFWVLDIGVPAP